jgi:hypothetical protein
MHNPSGRSLLAEIQAFVLDDFDPRLYLTVLLFLGSAITLNYSTNFANSVLFRLPFDITRLGAFFLLFAAAYYLPALLSAYVGDDRAFLRSPAFWLKSFTALVAVSLNVSLLLLAPIVRRIFIPEEVFDFVLRSLVSISGMVIVGVCLLIARVAFDRNEPGRYGLNLENFHWKPYAAMLAIVLPLVALASFQRGFLQVYPTYRPGSAPAYFGLPSWVLAAVYEFLYLLDFLFVELFFRGLLVVGMMRVMGRSALLPMTMLYTFIHFGKPLPEALTSAAGGYILGIVAYRSRSVVGGFIVHAGVAAMMELFAAVQHHMQGV